MRTGWSRRNGSASAASSTCPSSSRLLGRPSRCRTVGATSRSETAAEVARRDRGPRRGRAVPRPAPRPPRARRPGSPTRTSTSFGPSSATVSPMRPSTKRYCSRTAASLASSAGEVARRRLAELLHRDDVEPGQVDRLEVRRRALARSARAAARWKRSRRRARSGSDASRRAAAASRRPRRDGPRGRRGPPFSSLKAARSLTSQPFTASAGQVAHQLTTPTRRPFSEATFQNVLTLRSDGARRAACG